MLSYGNFGNKDFQPETLQNSGEDQLRTGSVGNRNAEDLIRTLPGEKKAVISALRLKLLEGGYIEDAEYDAINVEPVLKYSKSEYELVFLRFKWELAAMIPVADTARKNDANFGKDFSKFIFVDDDGIRWLKFKLPDEENNALNALEFFRKNSA